MTQLTIIGFPKALQAIAGSTIRVHGGFYLNNAVAFSDEPTMDTMVNHTIDGATLVQGGSGINLPLNAMPGTGGIYPHVEGLLVSHLQIVQGVNSGYCMHVGAGVHIKWSGGMCAEARAAGSGFVIAMGVDAIRSVDIADVFIGANPTATGALHEIGHRPRDRGQVASVAFLVVAGDADRDRRGLRHGAGRYRDNRLRWHFRDKQRDRRECQGADRPGHL